MNRPSTSMLSGRRKHAASPVDANAARERPERLRRMFPVLLLAALCIAFSISSRRFLTPGNALIVLQQAVVLAVAALGMTFVALGVFAIVPAALVGLACGFVNGVVVAKGKVPSFIVTLGTMVVFRGVVLYFARGAPVLLERGRFLALFFWRC